MLYCWENIDVGQSWDSQGCVCLFIMEERIIASVAFSNFNRLVNFFFQNTLDSPAFFFGGVGGRRRKFGSFIVVVPSTLEPR